MTMSDFSIVSAEQTVEALRDSGYNSVSHAIAELIDNSIQAGATEVSLICEEMPPSTEQRYRRATIHRIAVADNGCGMTNEVLRKSLKFGDGSRLNSREGIGRFGVGLPNSSVSQCTRVDIWTWQNGTHNALRCWLDLDEIRKGRTEVPSPSTEPVPDEWVKMADLHGSDSGTLVVWSHLDRVEQRSAVTILKHSRKLLGRLYRHFLNGNKLSLRLVTALDGEIQTTEGVLPNDPLFLMSPSETSADSVFHNRPMFEEFGTPTTFAVDYVDPTDGVAKQSDVVVRRSLARVEARNERADSAAWPKHYPNPGDSPWGKDAAANLGVSLVRAQRELQMDTGWTNSHDPTERWWSIEVSFSPDLDELFGVVNNKQRAVTFSKGSAFVWEDEAAEGESLDDFQKRLSDEDDRRAGLLPIWHFIQKQIGLMRKENDVRRPKRDGRHTGDPVLDLPTVEDVVTAGIEKLVEQGSRGKTDLDGEELAKKAAEDTPAGGNVEETRDEALKQVITEALETRSQVPHEEAERFAQDVLINGLRASLRSGYSKSQSFFEVDLLPDVLHVTLNESHPGHKHLLGVLEELSGEESSADLRRRLARAAFAFKMLLFAWARMEDQRYSKEATDHFDDLRNDWGRIARDFFRDYGAGDGD